VGSGILAKANVRDGFVITGLNGSSVSETSEVDQALHSGRLIQIEGFYPGRNGMYYYTIDGEKE
jgi:hypothetical protein